MKNTEKINISIQEALDCLRDKPVKSAMLERLELIDAADKSLDQNLPQHTKLGLGLNYIANNCSLPLEKHDLLLGRIPECIPTHEQEKWISEYWEKYNMRPNWLVDGGHITFAWDLLLSCGISGLKDNAEKAYYDSIKNNLPMEKQIYLSGMVSVYDAYITYIKRYADKARKNNMAELAEICENISVSPPKTFYEAIQLIYIVGHFYSVYASVNSTLTYGRLDELLLPYYRRDIENNKITREDAYAIIMDFNCKNNLILGRGEHQLSDSDEKSTGWFRNPTYDTPQYVVIGGYSNENNINENELTDVFIESIVPRFENPVYVFRYTKETNNNTWLSLCDKLRESSSILVYNDETQIPAFIASGVKETDATNYTIHGCNWPDIPGKSQDKFSFENNLTSRIYNALIDENGNLRNNYKTIDELYNYLNTESYDMSKKQVLLYQEHLEKTKVSHWLSCTDCFYNNTVEKALGCHDGAVEYPAVYNRISYLGTATDMMAALDHLVFSGKYTLSEMVNAMKANFEGYEKLRSDCLSAPKFGNDDERADKHAFRLLNETCDAMTKASSDATNGAKIYGWNVTITDMTHIWHGHHLGATPDGRLKGEPVTANLSPTPGAAVNGLTALLNSISSLPFGKVVSGANNVTVRKDWISGDNGLQILSAVLRTYFEKCGMQVQVSVADIEELLDAQKNPEKHKDLMVRITGYSASFVDMGTEAQNEIIRRESLEISA